MCLVEEEYFASKNITWIFKFNNKVMASNADIYTTGYDVQLVDSYPPLLNCGICTLILRDAMHGCINHVFCKTCITKHIECGIKIDGNVMCPGGCNIVINPIKLEPSKFADRMVNTLATKCSNNNCTWHGDLLDLVQVHQINCDFILQTCINNGCNQKYLKKDIFQHNEECLFKIIQCSCCQTDILRMNKEAHDVECLNEQVLCIYYDIGCKKELCRKDIYLHEQTNHAEHTRLIYQNLTNSNNIVKIQQLENNAMKQQIVVLMHENAVSKIRHEREVNILRNDIAQLQQQVTTNTTIFQVSQNEKFNMKNDNSKSSDKIDVASNEVVLNKLKEEVKNTNSLKLKLNEISSLRGKVSLIIDDNILIIKNNSNNMNFFDPSNFCNCYETNDFDWLIEKFGLVDNKSIMKELINNTQYHLYDNCHDCYMFVFKLDLNHIKDTEVLVPHMFKMTILDNEIMLEILHRKIRNIYLNIEKYEKQLKHQEKLDLQQLDRFAVNYAPFANGYACLSLF